MTNPSIALRRAHGVSILLAVSLSLLSCGETETQEVQEVVPPAATEEDAPLVPARAPRLIPKVAQGPAQRAFTDRPAAPDPPIAALIAEADPVADGWASEEIQERARKVLTDWLEALRAGETAGGIDILGDEFRASALRPPGLSVVLDDGSTRVLRAHPAESEELVGQEMRAALGVVREHFGSAQSFRAEVEFVHAELIQPEVLESDALLTLLGEFEGKRLQWNSVWRVQWEVAPDGKPRLFALHVLEHEEVETEQALFGDLTNFTFGHQRFFKDEFLFGVDDYYRRRDSLAGSAFIGGQGLAVGDVNGDGRDDIFVAQAGGLPNRLFVARADGRGEDQARKANLNFLDTVRGAIFADLDNDGDQDLAMGVAANVIVVFNDGEGVFSQPVRLTADGPDNVFSLCAADPDGDGDLDIYATRYVQNGVRGQSVPTPYHDANNGSSNYFWRNEGDHKFSDATEEVGLDVNNTRFSLAAIWEDFDLDGDVDLYVCNDFGRNNLYRNEGGHFTDVAAESGASDMAAGMGATVSDYDQDGDMDLYVSNMFAAAGMRVVGHSEQFMQGENRDQHGHFHRHARGNTLLANRGDGTFEDVTIDAGVARGGWAWGALFSDFDNDGWEDLYVPNGFITGWEPGETNSFYWRKVISRSPLDGTLSEEYVQGWTAIEHLVMRDGLSWSGHERNRAYLNTRDGRFADVGAVAGIDFLEDARAVATLDWDDDGRPDLVIKSRTAPSLRLLRNQSLGAGSFVDFHLVGTRCNRDAIGARVVVEFEDRSLRRTLHAGSGYLAQSSKRLHFGLGSVRRLESVEVFWPDGSRDRFEDLAVDQRYRLVQGAATPEVVEPQSLPQLASEAGAALTQSAELPLNRLVLVQRIPVLPLTVPAFDDPERSVADLLGGPMLLDIWSSTSALCRTELERLSKGRKTLREMDLRIVSLTIEDEPAFAGGRALLERHGLGQDAGYLDERARLSFEVLLSGVFGRTESTPLPSSFLIDTQGQIAVIYLGPIRLPQLMRDLALINREPPGTKSGDALLDGYWLSPPKRRYGIIIRAFSMLGMVAMREYYRELGR